MFFLRRVLRLAVQLISLAHFLFAALVLSKVSLLSEEEASEGMDAATGLGAIGRNLSIILSTVETWDAPGT